jgi:Cof subfamily protein (haloacid dehalogenase superfamily)
MVAVDLDGTLLDSDKRISEPTLTSLRQAVQRGVKVVIASARPPRSVRAIYRQLGLDTPQINYNGALVWDEPAQRVLLHRPIRGSLALQIVETARDLFEEVLVHVETLDRWYTDREDHSHTTETGKLFKPDRICPAQQFCAQPVTKLMLLGEPPVMARLDAVLSQRFASDVTVLHTDRDLLQIMDRRVSKGVALKLLARHFGIDCREVMAIGDAPNDVGMLQVAGIAVAMDNAHALVKDVADWVAPSNDDHGVSEALRHFGVCE